METIERILGHEIPVLPEPFLPESELRPLTEADYQRLFEEMSGSAKGVTAAKMKSRKYIRNRGYGGSVRTADQAKVKDVFKRLTTMWKSLTPAQILAWNKLALSQEGRSVLGSKAKISGAPSAAAPKIFFRYYYVNSSTGEKSGTMLAEVKWAAAAAGGGEP